MNQFLYPTDWVMKLSGIILLVVIFNIFSRWLLLRLEKRFHRQGRYWHEGFVSALYMPLSYYAWFFAFVHSIALFGHSFLSPSF